MNNQLEEVIDDHSTLQRLLDLKLHAQRKLAAEIKSLLAMCSHPTTRLEDTYVPADGDMAPKISRKQICATCGYVVKEQSINRG